MFFPSALKEWNKIGSTISEQLKKKLKERLEQPEVPADRLHGFQNHYKIKLRSSGYRLVYEVEKGTVTVIVITVGKRERSSVCLKAARRTKRPNQAEDDNSE